MDSDIVLLFGLFLFPLLTPEQLAHPSTSFCLPLVPDTMSYPQPEESYLWHSNQEEAEVDGSMKK